MAEYSNYNTSSDISNVNTTYDGITRTSIYLTTQNTLNVPETNTYGGNLINFANRSNFTNQLWINNSTNNLYIRSMVASGEQIGTWGEWEKFVKENKNDVGNLNNVINSGLYSYGFQTANRPNIPAEAPAGSMLVVRRNDRMCQLVFNLDGQGMRKIYGRQVSHIGSNSPLYYDWKQIYPDYSNKEFSNRGYIVFTNGLIIQWDDYYNNNESSIEITLPINFNITNYKYMLSLGADYYPVYLTARTRTINSFNITFVNAENKEAYGNWITIGW